MFNPRNSYGETLVKLGKKYPNLVVLDADLSKSTKTIMFAKEYPERFFEMGIAEANMISTAAGLASCGKIPFVSTFAVFATGRVYDQIRMDVAYSKANVKIFATHGWGGGHYVGGKVNKLVMLAKDFDADIYLFGHLHEKLCHNRDMITCSNTSENLVRKKKVYCLTGTFLNPYKLGTVNYAEKKCYSPGNIGVVKIIIKPFRHEWLTANKGKKLVELPPDIHATESVSYTHLTLPTN